MKDLDKRLQYMYSQAYKQAVKNNKNAIAKLSALPASTSKAERALLYREVTRTSGMIDIIASEIARTGQKAAKIVQGEMTGIFDINYEYDSYNISKQIGLDLTFSVYDRNQIAAILQEEQSPFTKIAYKKMGSDKIIVQRLGNALAVATINGESQAQIINRIKDITGQSYKQARRVAQTERTRVQSQGRNQSIIEAAGMGINISKKWIARMRNTRDLHVKTNGQIVGNNEKFSNGLFYPGDPNGEAANVINCFCVLQPIVKPRQDRSVYKNNNKISVKSFDEYEKVRKK